MKDISPILIIGIIAFLILSKNKPANETVKYVYDPLKKIYKKIETAQ